VWGVRFGVWGVGFGVWGVGCGVWGLGFGVWGSGFRVWGLPRARFLRESRREAPCVGFRVSCFTKLLYKVGGASQTRFPISSRHLIKFISEVRPSKLFPVQTNRFDGQIGTRMAPTPMQI
jgi:hypothetical protein